MKFACWPRWITAALMGIAASCGIEPGGWVHEDGDLGSRGGAASVLEPNIDATESQGPGQGQVGAPCDYNDECVTDYCMTTEAIGTFIRGAVVPNGYCSSLFCALDGSDTQCTAGTGGVCFSLFAFLPDFGDSGICLRPCHAEDDCRGEDDNVCFDAADLVAQGLLSADVLDSYYANGTRGCMPKSVVDAAVEKLRNP